MTQDDPQSGTVITAPLAAAISSIGRESFADMLLAYTSAAVQTDHLALFRFDDHLVPELFGTASTGRSEIAREAGKLYQSRRYYRHDPGTRRIRSNGGTGGPVLFQLKSADIRDREYHDRIYARYDIVERLSMIDQIEGAWIAVNLYRSSSTGPFGGGDVSRLGDLAPIIISLAGRHADLGHPRRPTVNSAMKDALFSQILGGSLSSRERAVCVHALGGLSVKRMAQELGVQPTTIATLRRRAFQKLEVKNTIELFVKCIAALTLIQSSDDPPDRNHVRVRAAPRTKTDPR